MGDRAPDSLATSIRIEEGDRLSRGEMLVKGALATAGLYGLGAVSPFVHRALAAEPARDDVEILNYLLVFEYLQSSLYNRGHSEVNDKGEKMPLKEEEKELIELLLNQEGEHVAAVQEMIEKLGGEPVKKGEYAFAFRELAVFLRMAAELEGFAIGAYNGAIPSLKSKEAQALASSITQVEGRHAASLLVSLKQEPAPQAFDQEYPEDLAINEVGKFTGVFS